MKTLSTLKTLPLVGLLAIGLALVPAVSMAGKSDRGHGHGQDKTYQKHDGGKSHHGVHHKSHYVERHHKQHKHGGHKHGYVRGQNHHVRHVHRPGHRHTDYVVVHDHHNDYDPFRLMLGLHFDNIDIIYRDF